MLFVSLNTNYYTFAIGLFKTREKAQHAFFTFLIAHENFERWFGEIKEMYQRDFNKELLLCNLESSLFGKDTDDEMFWDGSGLLPTIMKIKGGELFDFRMCDGWITKEWDRPPEYNHLYELLKACLEGETYEIDYKLYAKHYPVLFLEK